MSNIQRFEEILTQVPFEHNDLSIVNKKDYQKLFLELFEIYINSDAIEKSEIKQLVQKNRDLTYKLVHWIPPYQESDPGLYVKYRLLSSAIREGNPDFRDDLLEAVHLWDFAQERGLNAQEIFEDIMLISDCFIFHQVMDSQRRNELRF